MANRSRRNRHSKPPETGVVKTIGDPVDPNSLLTAYEAFAKVLNTTTVPCEGGRRIIAVSGGSLIAREANTFKAQVIAALDGLWHRETGQGLFEDGPQSMSYKKNHTLFVALETAVLWFANAPDPHVNTVFSDDDLGHLASVGSLLAVARDESGPHIPPPPAAGAQTTDEPAADEQLVTLDQMAAMVTRAKETLRHLKKHGKLPAPRVSAHKKGQPDLWSWAEVRPILEAAYGIPLPEAFVADRFTSR